MPDDRLEGLGMRCNAGRIDGRNDYRSIRQPCGIAAIAAEDAYDFGTYRPGMLDCCYQVRTDIPVNIAASHRQYKHGILAAESADFEPADEAAFPSLVVDASGEFRNVVGWCITLDSGQFAKIVDRMRTVGGASAHAQEEYPARRILNPRQQRGH